MKYVKFIAIALIATTVMYFAMAVIATSSVRIERSVAIIADRDSVLQAFSDLNWNKYHKVEKNIYGDSLLHMEFFIKRPELYVEGKMKFTNNMDTTFVNYINRIDLPLTMRLMSDKIIEVMTPEMDSELYTVKTRIEKK